MASPTSTTAINASATILRMSVPRWNELPHLALELAHAGVGLGRAGQLLGREERADVERRLRAVAQDLLAKLGHVLELWLNVREVNTAGREQLLGQILLRLAELLRQRARRRAAGGDQLLDLRVLIGREIGRAHHQRQQRPPAPPAPR